MDSTARSPPMGTQEEEIHNIPRPATPDINSRATQATHATPIRHRGTSSAAMSSSKWTTIEKINLDDMVLPIKNDISKSQDCKAADMLRFLFSFCDTTGDAAQVDPKDDDLMVAFETARQLANEPNTPLRKNLKLAIVAKDEAAMYSPLIKASNYVLDRLSGLKVPGLPDFQEDRQIAFARSDAKCIESGSYLQGSYKPDIVLVKWNLFKRAHQRAGAAYSESYESNVCCESGCEQPTLSWRNLLSTVEVKRGGPGDAGNNGRTLSKGKAKKKTVKSEYTGDFLGLQGDLEAARLSEPQKPAPLKMVDEGNTTRPLGTRTGLRSQVSSTSTSDRPPLMLQKRHRDLESYGKVPKRLKSNRNTKPGGSSGRGVGKSSGLETGEPKRPQKQSPKVQSAIYASHKLSSSFDISHTINLILIGTSVRLTWIDRQNVIESRVIDLVDDLPHFILLLLILQRFDDAKWGYFTECSHSGLKVEPGAKLFTVSFVADEQTGQTITIFFYPDDHEIYLGTTLIGRSTGIIGARIGPPPDSTELGDTRKLREGNDLVVKIYWPEERRTSEVEILKKAKEYGEKIDFIGNHIPEMVCHRDPNFLCSSTKTIRQFLGLPTDGSRRLRIIVFRRLLPIKELKEKDMLTAFLQCFFCHYCLWKKGIQHGDVSLGNLMWDDKRKVGILNDFDLARFADQTGASGNDNTGTLPFMALDLLSEMGLRGEILRRYRHEAESFTWSLICLYFATVEDESGKNRTRDPHPLLRWFQDWDVSRDAKKGLEWHHNLSGIPLAYPNTRTLASALHKYWVDRYRNQFPYPPKDHPAPQRLGQLFGRETLGAPQPPPPYQEPDGDTVFEDVLLVHESSLGSAPLKEIGELLIKMTEKFQCINWCA